MGKVKKHRGMTYIPYDYEAAFNKQIETIHEYFVEQMIKNKFKCTYACKEITAGEQFEIEIYPEFSKLSDVPESGRIKKDNSSAQKNLNDKNARKYVERLLNQNFDTSDIWITLTYSNGEEPKSMEEALRNMQNYIRRINYRRGKRGLPPAKYIYITEHSPDEEIRWHHHLVMDGMLDMDMVEATWKKGRRNETRRLEKDEYGLSGMSHYITKEKDRRKGEKRWNSSTNLKQFRVRKVYHKKKGSSGNYSLVGKFVNEMVKDYEVLKKQMLSWYPSCDFTAAEVYFNDFNGMFYIHTRMKKRKEGEKYAPG